MKIYQNEDLMKENKEVKIHFKEDYTLKNTKVKHLNTFNELQLNIKIYMQ